MTTSVTGLATDGAETERAGTFDGFMLGRPTRRRTSTPTFAENRQYIGYDYSLYSGPYNFGDNAKPEQGRALPYQNGLLIWYWDTAFEDNNVTDHPGAG